ncbi:heat-shock protein Hsp20 [Sulfuricella sp. T08]|nr:heat-shock protein Hsp20 [Sulfuricella sp. T08]
MQVIDELKEDLGEILESMAEGWRHMRQRAAGALTRFRPGEKYPAPSAGMALPSTGWALLAGDVFEDDQKLSVRLEIPGMEKEDLTIEVNDDSLIVHGEKRFEQESEEGRYRVLQCAYGRFDGLFPYRHLYCPIRPRPATRMAY